MIASVAPVTVGDTPTLWPNRRPPAKGWYIIEATIEAHHRDGGTEDFPFVGRVFWGGYDVATPDGIAVRYTCEDSVFVHRFAPVSTVRPFNLIQKGPSL